MATCSAFRSIQTTHRVQSQSQVCNEAYPFVCSGSTHHISLLPEKQAVWQTACITRCTAVASSQPRRIRCKAASQKACKHSIVSASQKCWCLQGSRRMLSHAGRVCLLTASRFQWDLASCLSLALWISILESSCNRQIKGKLPWHKSQIRPDM